MKKLSILLVIAMALSLLTVASHAEIPGSNVTGKNVKAEILKAAEAPVADGIIDDYEYAEIDTSAANMTYSDASVEDHPFELYLCYDNDYLYYAIKTYHADHKNEKDDEMANIWAEDGVQFSLTKCDITEAAKADRTEFGYGLSSKSGKVLYNTWTDALKTGFTAAADDIVIAIESDGTAVYEGKIPAKAFGASSFKAGEAYKFMCMVNTLVDGTRQYLEYSTGCGGTKDGTAHATITLSDEELELPIVESSEAPTSAPATADPILAALAAVVSLAGCVVAKKKR